MDEVRGKIGIEENSTNRGLNRSCKRWTRCEKRETNLIAVKLEAFLLKIYSVQKLGPNRLNMESRKEMKLKSNAYNCETIFISNF